MQFTDHKKFYLVLSLLTIVRLSIIGLFELAPDEAYYWTWSQRLDWSYYDQGPMLALIIKFFSFISGHHGEWSVRLGSVVLSVISSWLIFSLTKRMFNSARAGWLAFLALNTTLLFSAGAILMMHDSIMVMFWLASLAFFYHAIFNKWLPGWYLGAVMLGLGGLSKYTMALFVPGLLLFLVLSPAHRFWWKKPHLYLAGVLTALIVAPVFIWNYIHDWASFGHIGDLGGVSANHRLINFKSIGNFLGGQLAVLSPVLGLFCLLSPVPAWRKWKNAGPFHQTYLFAFAFTLPVLLFFFILSFQTSVYANWPAPGYLTAFIILAGWLDSRLQQPALVQRSRRWLTSALAISLLFSIVAHIQVVQPILPLSGRAAESMNRIRGWREVGIQAQDYLTQLQQQSSSPVFLAARRYQLGGILWFYTPDHYPVQLFGKNHPLKNQFRIWDRSNELKGQDAVYVCQEQWEIDHIKQYFKRVEVLPELTVIRQNQTIRTVKFCYCFHLN